MNLQELYTKYIESKVGSWSEVTLKKERHRMKGVTIDHLMRPDLLFSFLKDERKLGDYSLKTTMIRAGEFVDYLIGAGLIVPPVNPVKAYMKGNANRFKHSYSKKAVAMTFEDAARKIEGIEDEDVKAKAKQLLYTGMRFGESLTLDTEGQVVGKGGYKRDIPMAKDVPAEGFDKSYHTLYRALKEIGLTPHTLRKLCATKLASLGAQEADLMKIMGWRTSQMASIYVQAERERELTDALKAHLAKDKKTDGK